jgi:hypothetical protein
VPLFVYKTADVVSPLLSSSPSCLAASATGASATVKEATRSSGVETLVSVRVIPLEPRLSSFRLDYDQRSACNRDGDSDIDRAAYGIDCVSNPT